MVFTPVNLGQNTQQPQQQKKKSSFAPGIIPRIQPPTPKGNATPFGTSIVAKPFNALSNVGVGIGSALGKGAISTAQLPFNIGTFVGKKTGMNTRGTEAIVGGLEKVKQGIYQKPFEAQLATGSGKTGNVVGNVIPYFAGAGAVNSATKSLPLLQRIATRTVGDVAISQTQTGGDFKTGAATAIPSLVGNALFPGGSKVTGALSTIGRSTATGYTSDVASGMAGYRGEDRAGGKAFIPGVGTALGAAFGTAMATPQIRTNLNVRSQNKSIEKNVKGLDKLQKSYSSLDKKIMSADRAGVDVKKVLAESDLLSNTVDKNGTINTKDSVSRFDDMLKPWESKVGDALEQEGKRVTLAELERKVIDTINKGKLVGNLKEQAKSRAIAEIQALAPEADDFGAVPLKLVHDLKVQTNQLNAKSYLDPEKNQIGKTIGRGLKEFVEESTDAIDAKQYNEELRKMYAVREVLEGLNGKKVQGGRLGKYFAQTVGAVAGSSVGGPIGAVIGAEAGGALRGVQMSRSFGTKGTAIQPSERLKNALYSKNVGPRQMNQTTTTANAKNDISSTILPKSKNTTSPKKVTPEKSLPEVKKEILDTQNDIAMNESVLNEFPYSSAKTLMKFYQGGDKSLAELNYSNLGKGSKSADLDSMVTELGFKDLDEAEDAITQYIKLRDSIANNKKYLQNLRKEARRGEDVATYDTPAYYSKEVWNGESGKTPLAPLMGAGAGSTAGFEKDETGKLRYNVVKGTAGAFAGAMIAKGAQNGSAGLSIKDVSSKKDFIDDIFRKEARDIPLTKSDMQKVSDVLQDFFGDGNVPTTKRAMLNKLEDIKKQLDDQPIQDAFNAKMIKIPGSRTIPAPGELSPAQMEAQAKAWKANQPLPILSKPNIKTSVQEAKLMQEAKKYKMTINIQDKNDLDYLRRIFSNDQIDEIKNGKKVNWRGESYEDIAKINIISENPKTIEQQLEGKIKDIKLKSDTFYHGTNADNARGIMQVGFKKGSDLPEDNFRGGGYGKKQNSISFAETPKEASIFSTLSKNGEIVEAKLKPNAKVVSIEGIEDSTDLDDYIEYLIKEKIDAVYIGGGEKELAVINPKVVIPTKSQLTDIWNKSHGK